MRMIISMKIINCNGWAQRNQLLTYEYSKRLAWFYYKLGVVIYDEALSLGGDYFNEDN
jgi:hypothetical protein